ncbi:cholecystokinin receptor type A-like [Anthonomus grandis grandis]|uniref:cholecystokinin receptor type A-like n=1 Tax=Anthonomus grandis grandis TaxID=2921223 RepID=UPI002164FBF0|nr:cholecystokinin receptor type A-like [Anthonomus grandis grandis]
MNPSIPNGTLVNDDPVSQIGRQNSSELLSDNMLSETGNVSAVLRTESVFESQLMVPLYVVIFLLSIVGNTLVLFTLSKNKRMRTVTNVYLLNLAVADLLLGVFCMPFTLVGQVLRNFIFGEAMCKLIPYFQAVSVSVAVWTLVAISLERYFAICRPLKSRRWQTRSHASKMIAFVWTASLLWSGPIVLVSKLQSSLRGHKCRESWPTKNGEQMYNLFLDIILLLIPLLIMILAYFMIMEKLWRGLQKEIEHNNSSQKLVFQKSSSTPNLQSYKPGTKDPTNEPKNCDKNTNSKKRKSRYISIIKEYIQVDNNGEPTICHNGATPDSSRKHLKETTYTFSPHVMRSNYMDRSIEAKRKVIRMLFVIVAEFFICWAPLHILNTWYLYNPKEVYELVGSTGVSLVQLLAYVSSCSNPITYCFMNKKFRQTFFTAFKCRRYCLPDSSLTRNVHGTQRNIVMKKLQPNSENDSTYFMGRISYSGRSDPEAEDRV